jgi:hypothetical protein
MKSALVAIAVFASVAILLNGQQSAPRPETHKVQFPRSCENSKQIDGKDQLGKTKAISPSQRAALIDAISIEFRPGGKIGTPSAEKKLRATVMETRVTMVDLNRDGIPEVIAQGSGDESCSPTGNCALWVFMRSGNGFKLILDKGAVQSFGICSSRANGFNDLVLGQHGSASESEMSIYRFADGKYRRGPCYDVSFTRLVGDEVQELEEPDVTP